MGDIILQCSGANPRAVLTGNLSVVLPTNITNRVDSASSNQTHDVTFAVDSGAGFVPLGIPGLINSNIIAFNGINITVPSSGNFNIRISNIRGNVNQLGAIVPRPVQAQLTFSSFTGLQVDQSTLVVAFAQPGLFATLYDRGITCTGSPLPGSIDYASLFAAATAFASTRVTEGFSAAFLPRAPTEDNGTRFLVKYSSFPANSRLFVPDAVAGTNTVSPTNAGDLGGRPQIGQYLPGSGTLLLVRVAGADSNGAGGALVPLPQAAPGSPITLSSVSEVALSGGGGYVVYEVVDSNPDTRESAQFPTFFGIPQVTAPATAQETVSFAPVSNVFAASPTAPIQRFAPSLPASDCNLVGDCGAAYFPKLSVATPTSIQLTATAGGDQTGLAGYIPIDNAGGGVMSWTASVAYQAGSGWLRLDNPSGANFGSIIVTASGKGLAAGVYHATITIDAGPAGSVSIPVTLAVNPAPPVSTVVVSKVVNAATFDATPMVPGSLGTVMGSHLAGKVVAVTFDGAPANLLYTSDTQINFQVPDLGAKSAANLVVTADGVSSTGLIVPLSPAWPSVFANGILNQDNSVNGTAAGARAGSILQIFATGIPASATVSVQIAGEKNLVPLYAGQAPTVPGVQQVNVAVPAGLSASTAQLTICANVDGQQYCSAGSPLVIQ